MIVYTVRHLLPVTSAPVADAAVAVDGRRIAAFGRRRDVLKAAGSSPEVRELGDAVVFPGLVNAHTHLELSWMAGPPAAGTGYVAWLEDLVKRRAGADAATIASAAERALAQAVARATAAVGDVGNGVVAPGVLARSGLHGVFFLEVYGLRLCDAETIIADAARRLQRIAEERDVRDAEDRLRVVLTPHAAFSTSGSLLRALAGRAAASLEPLSIHVAESDAETQLLKDGSGPLADFLKGRGAWDDAWKAPAHSPVEYLDRLGLLTPRTLAVHCVHVDHQDLSKLQTRRATVVTCPRSNRSLDVGKAPVPRLLSAGIPVALGTDSLASNVDLDMLEEMAVLREEHATLSPAAVLRMATLNGAAALGLDKHLGCIDVGKLATLFVAPLDEPNDDPLETVTWAPAEVHALSAAPWEAKTA